MTDEVIRITPENAREVYRAHRWREDQVVTEPVFGDRVWLRRHESGFGITDCCLACDPCDYHARLTHQNPGDRQ